MTDEIDLNTPDITSAIADFDKSVEALKAQMTNPRAQSHHLIEAIQNVESDARWLRRRILALLTGATLLVLAASHAEHVGDIPDEAHHRRAP